MRRLWTLALLASLAGLSCSGPAAKLTCQKDTDCFEGYRCDAAETKICLRACTKATETSDCLALEYCSVLATATDGVCREGKAETDSGGGDPQGGDPLPGDP